MQTSARAPYPVQLEAAYPDQQSRWLALLRLPLSFPVLIFSYLLQGGAALAIWAAVLVSVRIPRWLFDFQVALNRWNVRAGAYFFLLTDVYPPFEGDYPVRYEIVYPDTVSRWKLVIWKFLTSVPHFIVVAVLYLTLAVVMPIVWFAILFTGRYPQGLHGYVAGILRWGGRVQAYFLSLTDEFPPFSLSAEAGPGDGRAYALSSGFGILATGGAVAGLVIFFATVGERVTVEVSYNELLAGQVVPEETRATTTSAALELIGAADPADGQFPFLAPRSGHHFVEIDFTLENVRPTSQPAIQASCFSIESTSGDGQEALMLVVNGRLSGVHLARYETAEALTLFELPDAERPTEFRYSALDCEFPILPEAEVITYRFH